MEPALSIRDMRPGESGALGQLLVDVYSQLDGFPTRKEQPAYYDTLARIGGFPGTDGARVLVALAGDTLAGGVVYVGDMAHYGAEGIAPSLADAAGIRLLGVDPRHR